MLSYPNPNTEIARLVVTLKALKIIRTFVLDPDKPQYCYSLAAESGVDRATTRGHLRRFADEGWLRKVGLDMSTECKRPERQLYSVTDVGLREGAAVLSQLQLPSSLASKVL